MQKPFNRKLKLGPGLFMSGGNAPYASDLNTLHRVVDGNVWNESKVNLPGAILPRVADFNGTDDWIALSSTINIGKIHSIKIYLSAVPSININPFLGNPDGVTFIYYTNNQVVYRINGSGHAVNYIVTGSEDKIEFIRNNKNIDLFVDDLLKGSVSLADIDNIDFVFNQIGTRSNGTFLYEGLISEIYINSTDQTSFLMYPTGQGGFDYDLVSGTIYGTWSGTGSRYDYDINGSLYPLQNGLSMYSNVAGDLIRVPYDINGLPLVSPPVPAGYTLRSEHPASPGHLNMLSCLIDFDPDDTLNAKLDNFDRSNATIFNDDARAGIDYDAANPYRIHIDNLDPRILFDWRNVDHKGMLYAKIYLDENLNIIRIEEMLNYLTDKKDAQEYQVMIYCGYEAIIIVDENGDYMTDDDDYVIIEGL